MISLPLKKPCSSTSSVEWFYDLEMKLRSTLHIHLDEKKNQWIDWYWTVPFHWDSSISFLLEKGFKIATLKYNLSRERRYMYFSPIFSNDTNGWRRMPSPCKHAQSVRYIFKLVEAVKDKFEHASGCYEFVKAEKNDNSKDKLTNGSNIGWKWIWWRFHRRGMKRRKKMGWLRWVAYDWVGCISIQLREKRKKRERESESNNGIGQWGEKNEKKDENIVMGK